MGVAEGIRQVLADLVSQAGAGEIELVAHSTTQATNALLEGDVSEINRLVLVPPGEGLLLKFALRERRIPIGAGHAISLKQQMYALDREQAADAIRGELQADLPTAIIQPLAGGQTLQEAEVRDRLGLDQSRCVLASGITQVLGINARARTAGINAAMLPRMLETAIYTDKVVRELRPGVPLQVVRSDGGAMDIAEMRKQPILSIMSGPAAGASAALHRSGLSELVFIEVGGTSTDITLVQGGRVRHRNATVGGNRLLVPALDLRTLALGGGSMLDSAGRLFGPRSAHIAGLPYLFQAVQRNQRLGSTAVWSDGHGHHYSVVELADGSQAAYTLTDHMILRAAGQGSAEVAQLLQMLGIELDAKQLEAMQAASSELNQSAERALDRSLQMLQRVVRELISSHEAQDAQLALLGGGGGAPVIYRELAGEMGLRAELITDHPVISAVGAALAVTCVSLSRSTAEPRGADIEELTREVEDRLARQGAERVSTEYEYDAQRQVLTVTGRGNRPYEQDSEQLADDALGRRANELLGTDSQAVWQGDGIVFYVADALKRGRRSAIALSRSGRSLWQGNCRRYAPVPQGGLEQVLEQIIQQETAYTDGGALLPGLSLLADGRYIPLDQLGSAELVKEVLRWENLPSDSLGLFVIR